MRRLIAAVFALSLAITAAPAQRVTTETATFAGGCFWCVEVDFDKVDGVLSTTSGFMGGTVANPNYRQVVGGGTGHLEVVQIAFDPAKVSYQRLVDIFFRTVDPLDPTGQFCDKGDMYRTAIFAHTPEQQRVAEAAKAAIDASKRFKTPVVTDIRPASAFTAAEDYHQDFYRKSPGRYYSYRAGCGRDARVKSLWGDEAGGAKVATQ